MLIISSPTQKRLIEQIKKYFYTDNIFLKCSETDKYNVYNSKGIIKNHIVEKVKNRWWLETI